MDQALVAPVSRLSSRTRRLLLTVGATYLGRFASLALLLLTIPLARESLTPDRFGLWMMLSSLLGFFSFADLGIGNGVLARAGHALHRDQREELGAVSIAGFVCAAAMGLLMGAVWLVWLMAADRPLRFAGQLAPDIKPEAAAAFTTFVVLMACMLIVQIVQKVQLAHRDGHWLGLCQVVSASISLVALPAALRLGAHLSILLLCTLGMQVLVSLVGALLWMRKRRFWPILRHATLQRATVSELLRTGSMFFVLQLSAAFAFQSDAFVVTQLLGQAAYGDFAAIQRLFISLGGLVGSAMLGLWPAFTEALARGDQAWARQTFVRALLLALVVMSVLCGVLSLCMPWLSLHWLHMAQTPAAALLVVLSTWTVIETLGQISGTLLNGAGIVRAQMLIALLMAGCAFGGKWVAIGQFGAWGTVLATVVAYVCISVPAQCWLLRDVFRVRQVTPVPAA